MSPALEKALQIEVGGYEPMARPDQVSVLAGGLLPWRPAPARRPRTTRSAGVLGDRRLLLGGLGDEGLHHGLLGLVLEHEGTADALRRRRTSPPRAPRPRRPPARRAGLPHGLLGADGLGLDDGRLLEQHRLGRRDGLLLDDSSGSTTGSSAGSSNRTGSGSSATIGSMTGSAAYDGSSTATGSASTTGSSTATARRRRARRRRALDDGLLGDGLGGVRRLLDDGLLDGDRLHDRRAA